MIGMNQSLVSISFVTLVLFLLTNSTNAQVDQPDNVEQEEFYKPNFNMDFKVNIDPWNLDCYYLIIQKNDILHVIVAVISGGDNLVDVFVDAPDHRMFSVQDKNYEWYDSPPLNSTGHYKVCVNNPEKHAKQVYLNIVTVSKTETEKKMHLDSKLNETHTYLEERIIGTAMNLFHVMRLQTRQRIDYAGDTYYVEFNNQYVMYRSIGQIGLMLMSTLLQTVFIKKLFQRPTYEAIRNTF